MSSSTSTLRLVHVVFRHGARTNEPKYTYPNDPHKDFQYHPYGLGQLTDRGKKQGYQLGTQLRRRYKSFLNDGIYSSGIVEARSTDCTRTKLTLQLVLDGLFPPVGHQVWNKDILWQPLPIYHIPPSQDKLFVSWNYAEGAQALNSRQTSKEYHEELTKHAKLMVYLTENSGKKFKDLRDIFFLYYGLYSEEDFGLKLPEWTKNIYPEPLESITSYYYKFLNDDNDVRRHVSGYLVKKMIDDSNAVLSGKDTRTKLHLYAAHEVHISGLLIAFGIFEPHIPQYCAHIIIEVHSIDGVDGIKVFYQKSCSCDGHDNQEPKIMDLGYGEFCPLDEFVKKVQNFLPDDDYLPVENHTLWIN